MLNGRIHIPKRIRTRFQRQTQPGAPPGSIVPHPDAKPPRIRIVKFGPDTFTADELNNADQLAAHLTTDTQDIIWLDVDGLGDANVIRTVGDLFHLHPLALEDVVNVHQRPKVDTYEDYLFIVTRAYPRTDRLDTDQVALFLGERFVISFQEGETDCLDSVRKRLVAAQGRIRALGADFLMYSLLDSVIDSYFPALELYGDRLDRLDDRIAEGEDQGMMQQIHDLRSDLLTLRRAVWPLRDAINVLIRDSGELIRDETRLYLRDCYDHTVQIIDVIETDRELCADLRDFYLTVVSNRMNQVMKFLTIIATLFIPLTFIAGLYGMNFNPAASPWNMPELNWRFGYPFALTLMVASAILMTVLFWRRGWLR